MIKVYGLIFSLFMCFSHLQAQIVHNFFGDELMTFRENNSWIVGNSVKEIYEKTLNIREGNTEIRKYSFDHNGLPVTLLSGTADSNWMPGMPYEAEVEYQFVYLMEDLFLRREISIRNVKGLMKRENIYTNLKYINYFNRPEFTNDQGLEMNFYFTPGGRPLEITIKSPHKPDLHFHFSYQSNRLLQVIKLETDHNGKNKEIQRADYEYDRNHRPERITVIKAEQLNLIIEIEYDQAAFPKKKTFIEGEEVVREVSYFFLTD